VSDAIAESIDRYDHRVRALVIGGTGPTGPDVIDVLHKRGLDVTILHRGTHEPDDVPVLHEVEHIHADPHFAEPLVDAVRDREFEIVIAMYGRMVLNATVFTGRCERFISVGGNPSHRGHLNHRSSFPSGVQILADETSPTVTSAETSRDRFAAKVLEAERTVLAAHDAGAFCATHLRYPMIYGDRAKIAFERWAVRRILDGHRRLLVADGGLSIYTRGAAVNAAHLIGLILDHTDADQCADDRQYSLRQWLELIAAELGVAVEIVAAPLALARPVWHLLPTGPLASPHTLLSNAKAKRDLGYVDVVAPRDALASLVQHLAAHRERTDAAAGDEAAELAVIEALDRLRVDLAQQLDWEDTEEPVAHWHPYDHPTKPVTPPTV
jgi:nucleoside-diphosphate-sugar epimerase